MELTPYVDRLGTDLVRAATLGDPATQEAAQRLVHALEPSLRMAVLEVLADATAQISSDLHDASVEVRLDGREPRLVVTQRAEARLTPPAPLAPPAAGAQDGERDGDALSRITLRLPESLKARADASASDEGLSLNTWIVNAIGAALGVRPRTHSRARTTANRLNGWI